MCGTLDGDFWETRPSRRIVLLVKPQVCGTGHSWTICDECFEGLKGLQNAALPKPDQVWLLSQVRRATIDDQKALLEWLHKKFTKTP